LLPLTDLAWLVGSWAAEADGDDIYLDCTWSPNKVYLMRDITIMRDGKVKLSVKQRIGLDPLSPRIKSWSFDADGGLSEAFWDKIGDNWYVASRGASPTGDITTARNTYSGITADSFTVESAEAHAGSANPSGFKLKFTRDLSLDAPAVAGNSANLTAAIPASSGTDSLEREKILNSPEWRQTQQAYKQWLSVQKIYTPAEVARLKAETAAKINSMSVAQLRSLLDSAHEKIQILMSTQAEDARLWLAQRMAVEVRLTPDEIKKERPDIPNMTAAQLELRLKELEQQRQQTKGAQQAFNQNRQFRIKSIDEQQKQANNEREQALNRAAEDMSGYGGYYNGNVGPRGWGGYRNYGGYRW
jgi:DNA-binding transcriptional MerR regulator